MRIVVSDSSCDSSCLIDLRKASLLDVFLRLPYEIVIPNTLFEEELIKFTDEQKEELVLGGLQIVDLPGDRVLRAQEIVGIFPRLSIHDCFAFALAESNPGCILLTGDGGLRELGIHHRMEVHGVLDHRRNPCKRIGYEGNASSYIARLRERPDGAVAEARSDSVY
jgi:hypothetical protein